MTKLRDKRAREGLAEVRGVWAPKGEHSQAKRYMRAVPLLVEALDACAGTLQVFVDDGSAAPDSVVGMNAKQARAAIKATEPAQRMRKEKK